MGFHDLEWSSLYFHLRRLARLFHQLEPVDHHLGEGEFSVCGSHLRTCTRCTEFPVGCSNSGLYIASNWGAILIHVSLTVWVSTSCLSGVKVTVPSG